jgi:hypothetical protein
MPKFDATLHCLSRLTTCFGANESPELTVGRSCILAYSRSTNRQPLGLSHTLVGSRAFEEYPEGGISISCRRRSGKLQETNSHTLSEALPLDRLD